MQRTTLALVVSLAVLGGCGTNAPQPTDRIEFNYRVDNSTAAGVVQVFDLGGKTVVQLRDIDSAIEFVDPDNRPIAHQIMGQTAVLDARYDAFAVLSKHGNTLVFRSRTSQAPAFRSEQLADAAPSAKVPNSSSLPAAVAQTGPGVVATVAPQLSPVQEEIARLKLEIAALRTQISSESMPKKSEPVLEVTKPTRYAQVASTKETSTIVLRFRDNSDTLEMRPQQVESLNELARLATEVTVTGYTDAAKPTPVSAKLAKSRAIAAARYLVSAGIDKSKIRLSFVPAGGFVADNATKTGRDANRRVEIELI